jgi:ParB/RepB/Spo0J family partition protein
VSKRGLPTDLKMRHDAHYVEELARTNRSVGRKILINLLEPNPEQPRTEIGDLTELSSSIKQKGVLEPILVKPNSITGRWMIIAGERRWRAANLAGLTEVPCIELDIDEKDIAEIALIENLQRKDLTIWEESDGFAYLIEKFAYTHEEIAKKIGKSRTTVTECLSIASLPEKIRAKCRNLGIVTKTGLLEIARQFDEKAMNTFLDAYLVNSKRPNNVKAIEKVSGRIKENQSQQIKNLSNENKLENVYDFKSEKANFHLTICFKNTANFSTRDILAALKESYNHIKAQSAE